jgi:hypothetical protein
MANQNLYIEEEQTTQWPKEKVQKDKQRSNKHTYKTKSLCSFSFDRYIVCLSSIYGFCLSLWYLQTLLGDQLIMLFYIVTHHIYDRFRLASGLHSASIYVIISNHGNITVKRKRTKGQTKICKTLNRRLQIEQHESQ